MEFEAIPTEHKEVIRARLVAQIQSMDEAEFSIAARTFDSLALFIGQTIQELAAAIGYIIAIPLAYAEMMARGFSQGFSEGLDLAKRSKGRRYWR